MITKQPSREDLTIPYKELVRDIVVSRLKLVIPIAIILYMAFSFLDFMIYPNWGISFLKIRLLVSLVLASFFILTLFKNAKRHIFWYLYAGAAILSSSMGFMIYLTDGSSSAYYSGINLVFLGVGFLNSFYYKENALFCFSQIAVYNLAMLFNTSSFNLVNFFFANFFLFSTTLFIILLSEFSGRQHFFAFAKQKGMEDAYAQLKEAQERLIHAERLSTVGQFASGIAHEVRNPLGIILQGVNYLENKIADSGTEISEPLNIIKENVRRADRIIRALLDFSKPVPLNLRAEDPNSILKNSLRLIGSYLGLKNIAITVELKSDIPKVLGDVNRLEQVFIDILLNAIQAMPKGGKVFIRSYDKRIEEVINIIDTEAAENFNPAEKLVIVEIEDTGIGISQENLKKVFDPFFTTKGAHGGFGLGLAVARNIITLHKGLIHIESQVGKGTKVTIVLKAAKP